MKKRAEEYQALTNIEAVGKVWRFIAWGVTYTGHTGGNLFVKEAFLRVGPLTLQWYLGEVER